jgi:hypothetical protein
MYLGIKHPSGAYDLIFITVRESGVRLCGAPSLTRGRVCRLQLLLTLTRAVILGSESHGARDHILLSQIRDFPFFASYDPQDHGGGILPRSHTGSVVKVKVKITLRLSVSQSLSLGVETHLGLMTRYLLLFDSYDLVFSGAPSLTRGPASFVYAAVPRQYGLSQVRVPWDS